MHSRFFTSLLFEAQIFQNGTGALGRSASRQRKTLKLAQPHVFRPNREACSDNVVSEKRLSLCKNPFAQTMKDSGRTRSLLMRARARSTSIHPSEAELIERRILSVVLTASALARGDVSRVTSKSCIEPRHSGKTIPINNLQRSASIFTRSPGIRTLSQMDAADP